MRVYELAKKLGVDTKKLIELLKDNGVSKKSTFSGLSDSEVTIIYSLPQFSDKERKEKYCIEKNNKTRIGNKRSK